MPRRAATSSWMSACRASEDATLFALIDKCVTAMGSRAAAPLAQPAADGPVGAAIALPGPRRAESTAAGSRALREHLHGIGDIERILVARRAALGAAARPDATAHFARGCCPRCARRSRRSTRRSCSSLRGRIGEHGDVVELLAAAIAAEPSTFVRDGDVIAAGYDAELDELRRIATHTDEFLLELEQRERERTGIAGLKLGFNRVQGFFIEITRKDAERVPKDYIRRQTVKSAERFITPELKGFEDKVLERARARTCAREGDVRRDPDTAHRPSRRHAGHRRRALRCSMRSRALAERACVAGVDRSRSSSSEPRCCRSRAAGTRSSSASHDAVRAQRSRARRGPPHAHHHRTQHGRQVDLHAPGGAHRDAGAHRQLRAGRAGCHRAARSHLHAHRRGG